MKNREKHREEILKSARTPEEGLNVCEFIRINVLPHFGAKDCDSVNCAWCKFLVDLWLDEEYEEPPKPEVDWKNVPVDTLVRVRNGEDDPWVLQYFNKFCEEKNYKFLAWSNGRTSKTAGFKQTGWKYCELTEVEEDDKQIQGGNNK